MSVNKVILIGNLGKDPELRFTSTGSAVARFPIATSEVWNDRDGNKQERTEWHNIIVWGKQVQVLARIEKAATFDSDAPWNLQNLHQHLGPWFEKKQPIVDGYPVPEI